MQVIYRGNCILRAWKNQEHLTLPQAGYIVQFQMRSLAAYNAPGGRRLPIPVLEQHF